MRPVSIRQAQVASPARGFTLIELMIVVAIIGILAAIAIPNFLRMQLKARSGEAPINVASLRVCETSRLAIRGKYASLPLAPPILQVNGKTAWVDPGDAYANIGFAPAGAVYFQYVAEVADADTAVTIGARADLDKDGIPQYWASTKPGFSGAEAQCFLGECVSLQTERVHKAAFTAGTGGEGEL